MGAGWDDRNTGYLLCELLWRHRAVGLAVDSSFYLPLTQTGIGDTLGLTPVHVNRVMMEFRRHNLITAEHSRLHVLDARRLQEIAGFNESHLNLDGASDEVARDFDRLERQASPSRD